MNIKAIIPAGLTEITVHGLHQWDYGRKLEIHSADLPALVEVHFACAGMTEAVVRSCSVTNGVATAAIPDRCLEQTTPITAWVYALDGSSGATTAKINLVIEPRIRPCPSQEIPEDIADKYTEAVTAMNAAVNNLKTGNVTVARAIADGNGKNIENTYATQAAMKGEYLTTDIGLKIEELCVARRTGVHWFRLAGAEYDNNLPATNYCYGYAVAFVYGNTARVYLLGDSSPFYLLPVLYSTYSENADEGQRWSGWIEMIDSENIGTHTSHLVNRADMVYSMKKTLSSVQLNTEYVLGTMPADLWGDGGSYIDPNESVLKVVVRLHNNDVELTASSGTNAAKQKYKLHGAYWNDTSVSTILHYMVNATIWRMGSEVRIKFESIGVCDSAGGTVNGYPMSSGNIGAATVRVDFHRAITN